MTSAITLSTTTAVNITAGGFVVSLSEGFSNQPFIVKGGHLNLTSIALEERKVTGATGNAGAAGSLGLPGVTGLQESALRAAPVGPMAPGAPGVPARPPPGHPGERWVRVAPVAGAS